MEMVDWLYIGAQLRVLGNNDVQIVFRFKGSEIKKSIRKCIDKIETKQIQ